MKKAVLIFAKNPVAGKVKTRIAATMGDKIALSVYQQLLNHTFNITSYLPVDKIVFYSDYVEENDLWSSGAYDKKVQNGEDLGRRMENAFADAFVEGNEEVIIIGTDCAELSAEIIMKGFAHLRKYDVIIGPATDGGYYLLGMNKLHPGLFRDIDWSTDKVLEQTISVCRQNKIDFHLLPELSDIDNEADLRKMKDELLLEKMVNP